MKRICTIFIMVIMTASMAHASGDYRSNKQIYTVADSGTTSTWMDVPGWATGALLFVPDVDNGAVGLEVTVNSGVSGTPMLKADGSADAVLCASGADPAMIDISDYIKSIPGNAEFGVKIRITCASQTTSGVTGYIYFKE